jgi:hypothetical protein
MGKFPLMMVAKKSEYRQHSGFPFAHGDARETKSFASESS